MGQSAIKCDLHLPRLPTDFRRAVLVVAAASAEGVKIERLRRELADTVKQLHREAASFERLLPKLAAVVGQSVRRFTFQLPAAFPMADVFVAVARALGAVAPAAA